MLVFGTEMELVTLIFTIFEILIFSFQFIYYLSRPQDQNRLWYLILLFLLLAYNITGGLFPDKKIHSLSIELQNIIAYSTGFAMACYIPYYFYKAYDLKRLRFHAIYGIYIYLLLPFLIFFVVEYSFDHDLAEARTRGVIIPFFWAIYFVYIIINEVLKKLKVDRNPTTITDAVIVCCAVLPWSTMPLMAYYNVSQAFEETVCNSGFLIITIIYVRQSIRRSKDEYRRLQSMNEPQKTPADRFEENCKIYNLTTREISIVKLIEQGLKYELIGERLFISKRTVSTHVQNIFAKVEVSNRVELLKKIHQ